MLGQANLHATICFEIFVELFHTPIFSQNEIQSSENYQSNAMEPIFLSGETVDMGTRKKTSPDSEGAPRHFIKHWRKHRRMTQEQLASAVGVATSGISQLETGKQGYSQQTLESIGVALRCSPADLISVDPRKSGDLVDVLKLIDEENEAQAVRVLKALLEINTPSASRPERDRRLG